MLIIADFTILVESYKCNINNITFYRIKVTYKDNLIRTYEATSLFDVIIRVATRFIFGCSNTGFINGENYNEQ